MATTEREAWHGDRLNSELLGLLGFLGLALGVPIAGLVLLAGIAALFANIPDIHKWLIGAYTIATVVAAVTFAMLL